MERSSSPTGEPTIDLRGVPERTQEQELRFQKLRGALIGRDGSEQAHLVGEARERVKRIADTLDDDRIDELITALWNTAPFGHRVPWLVDWLEDRIGLQPDKPVEVSRREIAETLDAKRQRLRVLVSQIGDDHDELPDLVEESDRLKGEIHDLELQLAALPSPPAVAAG